MDMPVARLDLNAEYDRVQAIVARHTPPPFVTGSEIEFGDNDGTPSVWVTFKTAPSLIPRDDLAAWKARAGEMGDFRARVQRDLLDEVREWYPYILSMSTEVRSGR